MHSVSLPNCANAFFKSSSLSDAGKFDTNSRCSFGIVLDPPRRARHCGATRRSKTSLVLDSVLRMEKLESCCKKEGLAAH